MKKQMLKFIFAGLLLCSLSPLLHAQVTVKYIQPPLNQWHVEDMWNLTIHNTSDKVTIDVFVTVNKSDEGLIIEGTSAPYLLEAYYSGPLSASDLTPVNVTYSGDQNYEEIVRKTGTLPEGEYTICVYIKDSETGTELGQDCIVQQIFPISPPALVWPGDKSQVIDVHPVFTWLLPTPATGGDIAYGIKLVEQLDDQGPIEAIESNPSWFLEKDISSTSIQIPVSVREFEPGKKYAWQVTAFMKGDEVGRSEVWSFTYGVPFQIQVDSLIFIQRTDEKTSEFVYDFSLYVTNVNDRNANLTVTGIIKTNPRCKGTTIKPDISPLMIPAGQQGVMTGIISSGKILLEQITVGAMLEDLSAPGITARFDILSSLHITPLPMAYYDYGDAQDDPSHRYNFPSLNGVRNGAVHKWSNLMVKGQKQNKSCLGKNVACQTCNPILDYIEFETNSEQVNADNLDDGVKFFLPESQYCQQCALDSIEVTFTIGPNYDRSVPLLFHGWFDFNRDGDWDDQSVCPTNPVSTVYEHVTWLSARQVCPAGNLPTLPIQVSNQTFTLQPAYWGTNCVTFRLYFTTGIPGTDPLNEMWTRFRLTPASPNSVNADKYTGEVAWGEVEDYPISCSPQLKEYDFGDAPDELDNPKYHYCTHKLNPQSNCPVENDPRVSQSPWTSYQAAYHENFKHEWLGDINSDTCSYSSQSADAECNGRTIDLDTKDDGVKFANLFHYPFQECDTQRVRVMVNTADPSTYDSITQLHLHAWFDWERNGQWDDNQYTCNQDHIKWLSAKPVSPAGSEFTINSEDFDINAQESAEWPDATSRCQLYELKFLAGKPATGAQVTDTLWCRFRLFYGSEGVNGSAKYYDLVKRGEVEDYPILLPPCDSADYGDAPDENDNPDYHFCTHENNPLNPPAKHFDISKFWMGDVGFWCECYGTGADRECDGKTIDQDNLYDKGVDFIHFPCNYNPCEIDTILVKVSRPNGSTNSNIYLNAWIDWNQDGDWDDSYPGCNLGQPGDHVFWLTAEPMCDTANMVQIINVNSTEFEILPQYFNYYYTGEWCQIFRMAFYTGEPPMQGTGLGSVWSRFRVSDVSGLNYFGATQNGEVEDYLIPCDSSLSECGLFTDPRDGQTYTAAWFCNQCWMTQNLNIGNQISVTNTTVHQTNNGIIEKFCINNSPGDCLEYGGLYDWPETMNYLNGANYLSSSVPPVGNYQGICPPGWHLPTDAEWCQLENCMEPSCNPNCDADTICRLLIGGMLKETGTTHWLSPNTGATNSSGFNARGGGVVWGHGSHEFMQHGHWWATDETGPTGASYRHLFSDYSRIGRNDGGEAKSNAHSVRCIRN
jgi:uncharacterized protein (TIGR02145 family)